MLDARKITKKIGKREVSEESSTGDEDYEAAEIVETLQKIQNLNNIAVQIVNKVRNILKEGVALDEVYSNVPRQSAEELERSMEWEDLDDETQEQFNNTHLAINGDELVDRDHLLSFVSGYASDANDSFSSIFTTFSDESSFWQQQRRNTEAVLSSNSPSVLTFSRLARRRARSVLVSENVLQISSEPRRRSMSVTVKMFHSSEHQETILEEFQMVNIE